MSHEAQRISIAESCGWEAYSKEKNPKFFFRPGRKRWTELYHTEEIPDYINDLNAMHEAENWLFALDCGIENEGYRTRYFDRLLRICAGGFHAGIHATAEQRAEAFLRTLNLWDDSK